MGSPSDIQIGSIRGRLGDVLGFVPGPAPDGTPDERQRWCRSCGVPAETLVDVARGWGIRLRKLGTAILGAGLGDLARTNRPPTPRNLLMVDLDRVADLAHAVLSSAIDAAEGNEVDAWQIEQDVLSNMLVMDQGTFQRFTTALRDCVEQFLPSPGQRATTSRRPSRVLWAVAFCVGDRLWVQAR